MKINEIELARHTGAMLIHVVVEWLDTPWLA